MVTTTSVTADAVARVREDLRDQAPLVHCLTNLVVANFTANALLAAGASPAMTDTPEDAHVLAAGAGAVLVNLGTVTHASAEGMRASVTSAARAGRPWVLDPVAAGPLPWRTALAGDLLALAPPAVVRGNASEVLALTGGTGGRGVESTADPEQAWPAARSLAGTYALSVAVSGPVDLITDGERTVRVANGHPLMTRVTGVGCVLGALTAGCLAVTGDALLAATAATVLLTLAGEAAAARAPRPGSFATALLDQLDATDADRIRAGARLA
ncbi:hydroxyethylthiazole kinase [Actinopolymorpha singaporensis]|uniref:Hydroxyethylthiazole kinase n=1 Tax=Actinopolymorpha singaporensis TaxID=117157 RepID=A0A1H1Y8E2_9ACTN|nr:hydroxyethylthiazole kinase [Actinopolymorpha singaporensis]SDT17661.1 hydroxyethylthiazole kinase [Actinopolymorpha singaporensis]